MAKPLKFTPAPVDPHLELMRRLETAPRDHAEALLVAWDVLQTAHDQGILDLAHGLLGGKNAIAIEMGKVMKSTEGVNVIRNAIALGGILASFDPDTLQRIARGVGNEVEGARQEEKAPSLWSSMKRMFSEDGRRGLGFVTRLLVAMGSAVKKDGSAKH